MRMLMKIILPTEHYNRAIAEKRLGAVWKSFFDAARPEATYYVTERGLRAVHVVLDMTEASQFAALAMPLHTAFGAEITCEPAMIFDDITAALAPSR